MRLDRYGFLSMINPQWWQNCKTMYIIIPKSNDINMRGASSSAPQRVSCLCYGLCRSVIPGEVSFLWAVQESYPRWTVFLTSRAWVLTQVYCLARGQGRSVHLNVFVLLEETGTLSHQMVLCNKSSCMSCYQIDFFTNPMLKFWMSPRSIT